MRFIAAFACANAMVDLARAALSETGVWAGALWFGAFCWAFNAAYTALYLREQSSS